MDKGTDDYIVDLKKGNANILVSYMFLEIEISKFNS